MYDTISLQIIPLLLDYFYNDISTLKNMVGSKFFTGQGSVNYLDMVAADGSVSDFEEALLAIIK